MARLALQPQVPGVVDVAPEYRMEEIEVSEGCAGQGKRIGEIAGSTSVVALRRADGRSVAAALPRHRLHPGDVLVAMPARVRATGKLENLFAP